MAAPSSSGVELGFVEEIEDKSQLLSHFFPSKVGGKPAWLCLKPVPNCQAVKCKKCGETCIFLLQIYAPLTENTSCFHRTLFVFVCRNGKCYSSNDNQNVVILRSQLPKINEFYSSEPPEHFSNHLKNYDYPQASKYQQLCRVCACEGPKRCGQCQVASYCSKQHQAADWKAGHKTECLKQDHQSHDKTNEDTPSKLLFPEFDIVTEPEDINDDDAKDDKTDEERLQEYKDYMKSVQDNGGALTGKDLTQMAVGDVDKQFSKFKKRIDPEPEQILRYERNGEPLWVSAENQPKSADIPKCTCGAERRFEFQVMPQLLSYLKVDSPEASIDWGTLAVYTCTDSCEGPGGYHPEFTWKQDFS